jgi:hypothetical protein
MHPLNGTWVASLEKSQRHPNHKFRELTMRFEIAGNAVTLTYEGVNAAGQGEASTQRLTADGEPYPVPEAPGFTAISTLSAHGLESIGQKDGATLGRSTYAVSADGTTMTATVSGIDAAGKEFDQVIVFDRA